MNNDQEKNINTNEPTVQPTPEQKTEVPAQEIPANQNVNEEEMALHTRIIQEEKSKPQINLTAYEKANEKKEKVEKTFVEDPHAGIKRVCGLILVLLLVLFAIFLPTITDKVNELRQQKDLENLIDGQLRCTMTKNSDTLKVDYTEVFMFKNSRIYDYKYEEVSNGSREDRKELLAIDKQCRALEQSASTVTGVRIDCESTSTMASVTQTFELDKMDIVAMKTAFSEAGGQLPEFSAGDNVDTVQSKVQSAGYTCEKLN